MTDLTAAYAECVKRGAHQTGASKRRVWAGAALRQARTFHTPGGHEHDQSSHGSWASGSTQTGSPEFKRWFGDSKVVDENGEPLVVYHGTTRDFDEFEPSAGQSEADWGKGAYFSNDLDDVEHNYAGLGPDLEGRLEQRADELTSDGEMSHDEALAQARAEWMHHEGVTIPAYIKIENPAVIGGDDETIFTYGIEMDDEGEYTDNETGTLPAFVGHLRDVASEYGGGDIDPLVTDIMVRAADYEGVKLGEISKMARSGALSDFTDDEGRLVGHEIIREALERSGFDGIIDRTVGTKFRNMRGMDADTVHYIVFKPTQIKSAIGNRGTFDPNDKRITHSLHFHTPGGVDHDQQSHGNRDGGRAPAGGAFGLNKEWYKGGQFLPGSERTEKGAYKGSPKQAKGKKAEIAPGQWAARPFDGARALLPRLSDFIDWRHYRATGQGQLHESAPRFAEYLAREFDMSVADVLSEASDAIRAWNSGVRWIDSEGFGYGASGERVTFSRHDFHTPGGVEHDQSSHGNWAAGRAIEPEWWNAPSKNPFAKGMTEKQVTEEWLRNSKVERTADGMFVFYHGTPRSNTATSLRSGSLLELTPEDAAGFARHDRGLPLRDVGVYRIEVFPWEIATGQWASLRADYPVNPSDLMDAKRLKARKYALQFHTPGGVEHDQSSHGNWAAGRSLADVVANMTLNEHDRRDGYRLVEVDMQKADRAFSEMTGFYIGKGGTGNAISNRYERFKEFLATGEAVEAPTVSISIENGEPVLDFGNGRHRFAVMRDLGASTIKLAMNMDSERLAHQLGWIRHSESLDFHTPGGVEHDQQAHGNWATGLMAAALASGGFTYQPHEHKSAPPVGYALSMSVANEKAIPLAEASADKIAEYVRAHEAMFDDPDSYVGGWIDTASGKLVLDVSKVLTDRDAALAAAKQYKQEAIYDLEKGETIKVGAQGDERRFATPRHGAGAVQSAHDDARRDRQGDDGGSREGEGRVRIVPATADGKPRLVSMSAFENAVKRVDFAVIDRRTELATADAAAQMARQVARGTLKALGSEQRIAELLSADLAEIQYVKLDGSDIGKIKAVAKAALAAGWSIGHQTAAREIAQAKEVGAVVGFTTIGDHATDYFEANGFRMAANVSDGVRAIIQQVLIQAVKEGIRPEDVTPAIFRALIDKGFTTFAALELESVDSAMLGKLGKMLRVPATRNVAHYINTLIRTNLFEAINEARFAYFTDPALDGYVEAFEYSAILDDRTTELCRELHGEIFIAGSELWNTYNPPNHYNCRSMLIPITEREGWDGKESDPPTVVPAEGFTTLVEKRERAAEQAAARERAAAEETQE